jgi:hypothetical protein
VTFPSSPTKGDMFGYFIEVESTAAGSFTAAPGYCVEPVSTTTIRGTSYTAETAGGNEYSSWLNSDCMIWQYYDGTLGWVLIEDSRRRVVISAKNPAATSQSISSGSWTLLDIDDSLIDTHSCFDATNSRFEIKRAGAYAVISQAKIANLADNNEMQTDVYFGATLASDGDHIGATAAGSNSTDAVLQQLSYELNAEDLVALYLWHNDGGPAESISSAYLELAEIRYYP